MATGVAGIARGGTTRAIPSATTGTVTGTECGTTTNTISGATRTATAVPGDNRSYFTPLVGVYIREKSGAEDLPQVAALYLR
jgi:hypothetical protein